MSPEERGFLSSLIPQFVSPGPTATLESVLLAVIFIGLELVWLSINALLASAAAGYLRRPLGKQGLNATTGAVLVGLGLRLVAEPR